MEKKQKKDEEQARKKLLEIRQGQSGTSPQIPFDYTGPDSIQAEDEDPLPPYIDKKGDIKNAKRTTYGQDVEPFEEPIFEIHMHQVKMKKNTKRKGSK